MPLQVRKRLQESRRTRWRRVDPCPLRSTATIFVPRRIKYELSAAHEWFKDRERCVFCDIVRQEEKQGKRIVDVQGDYYALCPYASRVPFEIWVLHRRHNHLFEQPRPGSNRRQFAALLGRVFVAWRKLLRPSIWLFTPLPTRAAKKVNSPATGKRWQMITIGTSKSCRFSKSAASRTASKKSISTLILPEQAAEQLRAIDPNT